MTNQEINIKIAESLGATWRCLSSASHATLTFSKKGSKPDWNICIKDKNNLTDKTIPDYCKDLNAMNKVESKMKVLKRYWYELSLIKTVFGKEQGLIVGDGVFKLAHASAKQKAIAYILMIKDVL